MAILISKTVKGVHKVCDHKCYRSVSHKCKCICGGMNHGKGLKEAVERTASDRERLETLGMKVHVEDRLIFDINPANKKVKTLKLKKRRSASR